MMNVTEGKKSKQANTARTAQGMTENEDPDAEQDQDPDGDVDCDATIFTYFDRPHSDLNMDDE